VLVRGVEPNMRWRGFCLEMVEISAALGVEMVVTLGALLADSPHTRPVPVSGTASDPSVAAELRLEASRYEGPTGIVGVFQDACTQTGMRAVSFWAAVPHYVASPPCPKATVALLRRVEDLLDIAVPLGDLLERSRAWEHQVDELAAEDSDVAEYIASLEEREAETDLPEASGEAIAKEFERYLRRRDDPPAR
jgi:proteasome assembly chaperone (PAC2) family protein